MASFSELMSPLLTVHHISFLHIPHPLGQIFVFSSSRSESWYRCTKAKFQQDLLREFEPLEASAMITIYLALVVRSLN